jgi:hypothetical protein
VAADVHKLKRRFDSLKADRATFESHWQEIAEVITPRKAEFVGMRSPGDKRMSQVYDETGIHALELLTAGLHGMATNPAAKWFSLRSVDDAINEQDSVKKYLADLEQIMWARMYAPGTGITTALNEIYADLGAFGTASLFITTRDDGGLLFQARHLGETLIAENSEGTVDTVFRCIRMTVRQMAQEFGLDACSEKVREAFRDEKYETYFDVVHAVCPRNEREYDKKDKANQPFASVYFEPAEMHLIEEGGFPEFPYACPRWSRHPGETYGRSPGMTALPAVKMLQASELATIKAMQKCVDPPLFLPDDGFLGPIRTVPGGLNFFRGNREIFPLPTPDKLPITLEWQESLRNRIRTIFFTDVLQFVADREMTATEVMQRTSERMRLLGPIMGRHDAGRSRGNGRPPLAGGVRVADCQRAAADRSQRHDAGAAVHGRARSRGSIAHCRQEPERGSAVPLPVGSLQQRPGSAHLRRGARGHGEARAGHAGGADRRAHGGHGAEGRGRDQEPERRTSLRRHRLEPAHRRDGQIDAQR